MPTARRKVIVAPYPRTMREIFADKDLERLAEFAEIAWASDAELAPDELATALADAWALVGCDPAIDAARLRHAPELHAIAEVGGHFPATIDYAACFRRGIRVLSCAPAFARQVAEMALGMTLAACRGLIPAHRAVEAGTEEWQGDLSGDFSLFGQRVGFVGFGSIARELVALLRPFGCAIDVFDPWLTRSVIEAGGCRPAGLDSVMSQSRVVFVLATPTPENQGLISRELIATMPQDALLVVISRAHLVDFDAVVDAADAGRIRAAIDVFPAEPMPASAAVRRAANVLLSPHRAASIRHERQAIGRMVVDDLELMARGLPPLVLQVAQPEAIRRRLAPAPTGAAE